MYVDGNTGSLIASAIVAGSAGVAVAGRAAWNKVKSPMRRGKTEVQNGAEHTDITTEQK